MTFASKSEVRFPLGVVLLALGVGALLLWPTLALGDSLSSGSPPVQYRGPSGEVPGHVPSIIDTTTGGDSARSTEGWARWEFWFEYEKDALLRRAMAGSRGATATGPSLPAAPGAPVVTDPTEADLRQKLLPALRLALKDPSQAVRAAAAMGLGNARDQASVTALADMLRSSPAADRRAAALSIGFLGGPAAVEPLARALEQDPDVTVRSLAAVGLGLAGDAAAGAPLREELSRSLEASGREAREMRTAVITALGLLRERSAVPILQRVLRGEVRDDRARAHAATALGRIGDPAAVPPLVATLRDEPDAAVRRSVALALGAFTDETASAGLLKAAQGDGDALVRGFAAISFARNAGPAAVAPLAALTAVRHDRSIRGFAAVALGLTGDAKSAAPVLMAILDVRSEDSLRGAAAVALGLLGDATAGPALVALASDPSTTPELRGYALLGSAMVGTAEGSALAREVLARKAPRELRRAAALAAGVRPFPGSPGLLVRLLIQDRDPTVRGAALLGIGLAPDRGTLPLLADLAAPDSGAGPAERMEAVTALGQIALGGGLPPVARIAGEVNYRELTPALEMATRTF